LKKRFQAVKLGYSAKIDYFTAIIKLTLLSLMCYDQKKERVKA